MMMMMNQFISLLQDSAAAIDNMVSGSRNFPMVGESFYFYVHNNFVVRVSKVCSVSSIGLEWVRAVWTNDQGQHCETHENQRRLLATRWTIWLNVYSRYKTDCIAGSYYYNFASMPVWSDDDWLKKFSGKTAEEAEAEAAGGESANTATKEVTWFFFEHFCSSQVELW